MSVGRPFLPSIVLYPFLLAFDIDHLPPCTYPINESENLYVNTIGKLFLFILLALKKKFYENRAKNIKVFISFGLYKDFQAPLFQFVLL